MSCYSGRLFGDLGFIRDTEASARMLLGTCEFPEGTDPATQLLFEEASKLDLSMAKGEIKCYATVRDFQYYWKRVK